MENGKLDKWDNLMIRACKGDGNIILRLRKIWRKRCLMPQTENSFDPFILGHLLDLIGNRKVGFSIHDFETILDRADPNHLFNSRTEKTYWEYLIQSAAITIRFTTPTKEWDGFRKSLYFRKLEKKN